jgi:hypothetical protein
VAACTVRLAAKLHVKKCLGSATYIKCSERIKGSRLAGDRERNEQSSTYAYVVVHARRQHSGSVSTAYMRAIFL